MLLMTISVSAFTSSVLNNPTYQTNIDGINYQENTVTENGSKQNLFYGEYNTTGEDAKYEWVIHSIRDGNTTTLTTVMNIAKDYENTTGRKVMLAVNGDYFTSDGSSVDSYVSNGVVYKKGNHSNKNCMGFDNNGKVVVGRLTETEVGIVIYDENGDSKLYNVDKFNAQPTSGEIAIFNVAGTYTVTNAGAMIVKAAAETSVTNYPVYGTDYTMTATGVQETKTFTLKSGQYAVVYTAAHNDVFANHSYGQTVETYELPAGEFEGCSWVIGGYDILVDNYVVNTNCHTDNSGSSAAPRTFMGFKEDGTGFVCVVDGRYAGGSIGITVNQEAQLASVLGAKYAIELDGGGSSTMIVRINDTLTLKNSPSDGSMRRISNAVLLVEKPAEEIAHECESICPECGKCLNASCTESVCAAKCEGHGSVEVPDPHTCESVCPECGNCLDASCTESACAAKCEGHDPVVSEPHECESKCEKCRRCLDKECEHDACKNKCQGHKTQPSVEETPENPILAFFRAIIEAIKNFFANLFK